MTKVTEEMVDAFYKAHDASLEAHPREARQALYDGIAAVLKVAALSASAEPGVGVKALEWRYDKLCSMWRADSAVGQYIAWCISGHGFFNFQPTVNSPTKAGSTEDEAKTAAQADYESRIRSALHKESGETLKPVGQTGVGDSVDKAAAWDAAQVSYRKGYERGKADALQGIPPVDHVAGQLLSALEEILPMAEDKWATPEAVSEIVNARRLLVAHGRLAATEADHTTALKSEGAE